MPTTAAAILDLRGLQPWSDPFLARLADVKIAPSVILASGVVLGELTAQPGTYGAYGAQHIDGTQIPKGILAYDVQTDAGGSISLTGLVAPFGVPAPTVQSVGMYYTGVFACSELTGMDANALAVLGGHLISGDLTSGVVCIG
ncbi:MAG: hypothetical protein KGJ62_15160 [Armatimonadetes bacterium]|nr:hypothetical protein [Armatimonadota bacterium]MDE2206285.1 hypothetical protein [Armatimonadota bacterium]